MLVSVLFLSACSEVTPKRQLYDTDEDTGWDVTWPIVDESYLADCSPLEAPLRPIDEPAEYSPSSYDGVYLERLDCPGGDWEFKARPSYSATTPPDEVILQVWDARSGALLSEHIMETENDMGWFLTLTAEQVGATCGTQGRAFYAQASRGEQRARPDGVVFWQYGVIDSLSVSQRTTDAITYNLEPGVPVDAAWIYLSYIESGQSAGPFLLREGEYNALTYTVDFEALGLPIPSGTPPVPWHEVPSALFSLCRDEQIIATGTF